MCIFIRNSGMTWLIMDPSVNPLDWLKSDYGNSGIFYAWFLAPKIKYCLVVDDFDVILAKRTFKGFSEEHRMIKLDEYISL